MKYRKTIDLSPTTDYWFVQLGELNRLNGSSSWPFPSLEAAERFAELQKSLALEVHAVHREVAIRYPDGTVHEL